MEVTVWGDLLFFVNFCIDFQCMFLTAKLLKRRFFLWRAVLFSALGATYAVAALFVSSTGIVALLLDLFVCFFMCLGAFFERGEHARAVLLPFFFYFGVSFLVGGAMSGMGSLLSRLTLPYGLGSGETPRGAFFFLALVGGVLTFAWGSISRRRAATLNARLRVEIGELAVTLLGVVDTANLLADPVSQRPVVILSHDVAKRLFSTPLADIFATSNTAAMASLPHEWTKRVRLLPSSTVTGERLLVGVMPDRAFLDTGKGERAVDVLLAFAPLSLDGAGFEALIPAILIT